MSRIAIIGLGNLGMPTAKYLHNLGFEVVSFSKSVHPTDWFHTIEEETFIQKAKYSSHVILAAGVSRPSVFDLETDLRLSLEISKRIFNETSYTRYLYFSTGAVYGECITPKSEEDEVNPVTPYGNLKLEIERSLLRLLGNKVTQLRIGNVFGQTQKTGLLYMLKRSLNSHEKVRILAPIESCRDYMLDTHFVRAIESIIESKSSYPAINIGSGFSLSISEVLDIFAVSGGKIPIFESQELNTNDVLSTKLKTNLLNSFYKPEANLQDSIFEYFKTS